MDLFYIKKRILDNSKFTYIVDDNYQAKIIMECYGIEISCKISAESLCDINIGYGDVESIIREQLLCEFIKHNLNKFIQLENRERNLNTLC